MLQQFRFQLDRPFRYGRQQAPKGVTRAELGDTSNKEPEKQKMWNEDADAWEARRFGDQGDEAPVAGGTKRGRGDDGNDDAQARPRTRIRDMSASPFHGIDCEITKTTLLSPKSAADAFGHCQS